MSNLGQSFGVAAGDYDRGRPSYPAEAIAWVLGAERKTVLDVGAGTGKLTSALVRLGHEVVAVDPDPAMLAALSRLLPDTDAIVGTAEDMDIPDESFDAVVFGQAWHWVDVTRASAEVGRVLRPGGVLGLLWNVRDETVPWVARLTGAMRGSKAEELIAGEGPRVAAPFGDLTTATFAWSRDVTADEIAAMVRSRSYYIDGDADYRATVNADVRAVIADVPDLSGGGRTAFPYVTHAFRAVRP